MKRTILTALLALAFGIGFALLTATPSMAVHKGLTGTLTCGNCHTMHNSQGNTTMGGSGTQGNIRLIRGAGVSATTADLCLACHAENGANASTSFNGGTLATTPPKVYRTTAWTTADPQDFSAVGAGGDFSFVGTYTQTAGWAVADGASALGKGHSINLANAIPPGNTTNETSAATTNIGTLTCTSCHDAHGYSAANNGTINKYRNLRGSIGNGAQNPWTNMDMFDTPSNEIARSYVGAVAGDVSGGTNTSSADNVWPVYRSTNSQNTYYDDMGMTVGVGMSRFCAQCHGAWHEAIATGNKNANGSDWNRHPVNEMIDQMPSGSGIIMIDAQNYFAAAAGVKLPVANDSASTKYYMSAYNASKVFCLSCHYAHGGPNNDILRWSYTSAVSAGDQTANGIDSNVGCQLCHNR